MKITASVHDTTVEYMNTCQECQQQTGKVRLVMYPLSTLLTGYLPNCEACGKEVIHMGTVHIKEAVIQGD